MPEQAERELAEQIGESSLRNLGTASFDWMKGAVNYEGEGVRSWFMNKATRLGDGGIDGAWNRLRQAGGGRSVGGGLAKTFARGAMSSFLPMEPLSPDQMKYMSKVGGFGKAAQEGAEAGAKGLLRHVGGGLVRHGLRWLGPVITTYRLSTETQGKGFFEGISKANRIIGEEAMMTGGAMIGGAIGTAMGGPVGTAVGIAVGMAIGMAGSYAWNKFMDVAEAPARAAAAGWKYFRDAGRRSNRLELGGQMSRANRTGMAYTMRQRALSQMNRSGINARSLLGREASLMHVRT